MASETYGTTAFESNEQTGRLMIRTAEGSSVAVPVQDVLMWAAAFVRANRIAAIERMPWQEVLGQSG